MKTLTQVKNKEKVVKDEPETPWGRSSRWMAVSTTLCYVWLYIFGIFRDFFGFFTGRTRFKAALQRDPVDKANPSLGFFPTLIRSDKGFYIRRMYTRLRNCFDLPICSPPGATIDLLPRYDDKSVDHYSFKVPEDLLDRENQERAIRDGTIKNCINLGSYNYLGFADNWKETCGGNVIKNLKETGLVATSSYLEAGYNKHHRELEAFVANFLHKEKAAVYSMGYGTNTTVLSSILTPGSVVVSDGLNHSSIINGCRGAEKIKIVPFKHNSMADLETILQRLHLCGQSYPELEVEDEDFVPWKKILVVVEGIYSMEGETCDLASVIALCKKYKTYIYVDEAHSIGALGNTGRGICEHSGVNFDDVDILMGTFSKSFGGMGGYVSGNSEIIDKLRASCDGQTSMSPLANIITVQVQTAFNLIATPGGIGQQKIQNLKENANYFRKKLKQIGCTVLGDYDSPVIPIMVFQPTKLYALSIELRKQGIAVVVVAAPAVSRYETRVRFCISAAHTKEQLRHVVKTLNSLSKIIDIRYEK